MCLYSIGIQMKRDPSILRRKLKNKEDERAASVETILCERGPLRRGSFVTVHRKCGKPNCHCATGKGHPAKYLSVKEGGKTRMVFIPKSSEMKVADEAGRYRRFRQARAKLAKLAKQSLQIIDELERALESTEKIPSKKTRKNKRRSSRKKQKRNKEK